MNDVVSYVRDGDVAVVTVNNPPVNALSQAVRQGLLDAIHRAAGDDSKAVLILCEGRTFIAGADITEFGKPMKEPFLPDLLDAIEASDKLVVAALHGTALGGGFETALASHYRVALDSARIGLPEVKLGLLPGAGGTQRAPRLAGVAASLDLILSGTPIPAAQAEQLGLVDKVVSGDLRDAALQYARELLEAGAPIRRTSELPVEQVGDEVFDAAAAAVAKRARGQTAPRRIIECVRTAMTTPFAEGRQRERDLFIESMQDAQSLALRHAFFAEREAAKIIGLPKDAPLRDINSVGIIGGGTMGGGIAMSFANAGIPVTLIEINDEALERGLGIIDRNYAGSVKRGKLSEDKAAQCRGRISGATDYAALADVDLVIEAVFEDPELKKEIFAKLDAACKPGAILATNTSYQDVNAIAAATGRPEDVLGMHFFSPAHIMKLLEVVRGDKTADDALATVMALSKKIRKVAVVSMGPNAVGDLAGLDVGYKAREALPEDERGDPAAYRVPDVLVEMGRLGQKNGQGFYNYDPETRRPSPDAGVQAVIEREAQALGIERREIEAEEIVDRLIFALANEGFRILEEGIAQRPGDIDIVYLYGYGFPAWRGGPMHYAESVGLDKVLARIESFRECFGEDNWTPAPLLEKLVREGKSLTEWAKD